ncbi:MAG TPA: ATP-binding protein, partial [Steroidobacteraceae bacterium]|nr:ATP-binding protein [Steroidobacteraceae bacterium]
MSPTDARVAPARITILPTAVADGIAAGEVVDRPAAVVKELVENAIDAGAARIQVSIEAAGQRSIEVVDDGMGMPSVDLPTAFRRHATSKLRSLEDLRTIQTLGFRGEALAS